MSIHPDIVAVAGMAVIAIIFVGVLAVYVVWLHHRIDRLNRLHRLFERQTEKEKGQMYTRLLYAENRAERLEAAVNVLSDAIAPIGDRHV